ncbi:DNA (cytosine-5)-methyltransferase CMT2-like isoform X1 [Typha latifolia]|uniref:DNA (cytosine-5)-methyltransferase CMT2-like isoform X1 n=1 Tax=Typha latifolia TaxID=4733 RepID=UPI003C2F534A
MSSETLGPLESASDPSTAGNGGVLASRSAKGGALRRSPRIESACSISRSSNARGKANAANGGLGRSRRSVASSPEPKPVPLPTPKKAKLSSEKVSQNLEKKECFFVGAPVPEEEARGMWPNHYVEKAKRRNGRRTDNVDDDDEIVLDVKCHYLQASICGCILNIEDCAYVKGPKGKPNYIGRILEFFETIGGENYFTVQWFFRAEDTVMKEQAAFHDKKRLFSSDLKNDNLLDCIVSKVRVVRVPPSVEMKSNSIPSCYFYYDMKYSIDYTSFSTEIYDSREKNDVSLSSCSSIETISIAKEKLFLDKKHKNQESENMELALLDLYCGCGGMSTGLALGTHFAGLNLVTRWAVDSDGVACQSLKSNHPETQVRNETADDFLDLLREWEKLCRRYIGHDKAKPLDSNGGDSGKDVQDCSLPSGEYEVSRLVDICYGDPANVGKRGLKFKVRWKGYCHNEDTWEPIEGLSNCEEAIHNFVIEGLKSKILPLPGDVDVICGGPPCQGISGYNRYRNFDAPLDDERNRQIVVFMNIVQFLKPKYVLMENVVDILKFAKATLARYALSRLVYMNYQARLGIMAAGCYGLPQFRLRVFLWGCHPNQKLPQFPLPTHEVILKYGSPLEFERNLVGYDKGVPRQLEKVLILEDVLSDLPVVTNKEVSDQMPYGKSPYTEFQRYIRSTKNEILGLKLHDAKDSKHMLYDHRPLPLSEDDYLRVCQIPKRKGANFRDLPGVIVGPDNTVKLDPTVERTLLPSGRPLIPDYAMTFEEGKSLRPFARLWWDEVVATVLTFPNSHSQAIIHPEQDRILTIRESARLQGFPDYYRFCGTVKDRYRQIGNAVAIPVGRALGYALALAWLRKSGEEPLMFLPPKFSFSSRTQDPSD